MLHDWKMELYWRFPVFLQEKVLSIYAKHLDRIYYGHEYQTWKQWLADFKNLPFPEIASWQNDRVRHILQSIRSKVPFYRESYKNLNTNIVQSKDDLYLLPLLEKQSIRQNEMNFLANGLTPKSLWLEKTSGTTGTALRIYWPMSMVAQWWAITELMVRHVAGVSQEIPRAMMGGRPIVKGDTCKPPYWRYNKNWKQLYLSSYHISKKSSQAYIDALRKYESQWMTGYGSTIAALAENALERGLEPYPLKAVIVSGDTLLPGMRRSIETFFQCRCFDHYGQCEGVAMAMECPSGRKHVIPVIGIIEILREDGSYCRPGEIGEVVATGLLNDAMPLIRYRIGDYAAWAEDQHCSCGNPNPIITDLMGRVDDYLITADGRKVGRLAAFRRSPSIHSAQLVQDKPGHAFLLVRPGSNYKSADAEAVRADIMERVGKFAIDIIEVQEIPKTPQGKAILVVRLDERIEMRSNYSMLFKTN